MFAAQASHPQANALYTLWIGSNDVLDIAGSAPGAQQTADIAAAVNNEVGSIAELAVLGARSLVVLDVPDLGKTPCEAALEEAAASAALKSLAATGAPKIDLVDTYRLIDAVIANPGADDFTNVIQPIWTGNYSNLHSGTLAATGAAQNGYLFFDSFHPTAQAHALIVRAVDQSLTVAA